MEFTPISIKELNYNFLNNKKIALKTCHNSFVRAFPGGADKRVDLQTQINDWETYTLIFHGDGLYSFQTFHGSFLRAWPQTWYSNCRIDTQSKIEGWEKWRIIPLNDNKFAIQSCHNTYMCGHPGGEGGRISLQYNIQGWERFEIVLVRSMEVIEDIEFILNNIKIISRNFYPIYESTFTNETDSEQIFHLNFEKEVKIWSKWSQNTGKALFDKNKVKFKKLKFQDGQVVTSNFDVLEVDLKNEEEIVEINKVKADCRLTIIPKKKVKFSSFYEEIIIELPWIGIFMSNEKKKDQITGVWKGSLIGELVNQVA